MLKAVLITAITTYLAFQEGEDTPNHVTDPAQCTSYCYPHGGPESRPKGVPEGVPGSECQGDQCSKVNDKDSVEEDPCNEGHESKCSKWCSKVCCTCLAVCM